jgi:hypothetical protein
MVRGDTGAFSTADDLAAFGQMMLNGGSLGGERVLSPVSVRQMVEAQFPWGDTAERLAGSGEDQFTSLSKGLGWMVRGAGFFRGSDLMSHRAFFHGGYLGMRVIVDPEYDLVSVFLTSIAATKPSRDPGIGKVGHVAHMFGTLAAASITDLQLVEEHKFGLSASTRGHDSSLIGGRTRGIRGRTYELSPMPGAVGGAIHALSLVALNFVRRQTTVL